MTNNYGYNQSYTMKATFTADKPSETTGKPSYFVITMKKGDTLQLGVVVTEKGGTAAYTSSKSSVVSVSKDGKVTAKGKGSAIITLKYGTGSIKLKIKVV